MKKSPEYIVVVGASAGGTSALAELAAQLDKNMDAAFFIVLHLSDTAIGELLQQRLSKLTPLPCTLANDNEEIQRGHIYIAQPDYHLIVKDGYISVVKGPIENRWRPSINVLFRSAAVAYNSRAVGIILTGLLDDGTSGMLAIKRCGGAIMVQDPNEAEFPDMPLSVLNSLKADYCLPLHEMGSTLKHIFQNKDPEPVPVPDDLMLEVEITAQKITNLEATGRLGSNSVYACPECGGGLWEIDEDKGNTTFRCHVGHSFSIRDLESKQGSNIEATLWVALRMMEERSNLLRRKAANEEKKGLQLLAKGHLAQDHELGEHIAQLKNMLFARRQKG